VPVKSADQSIDAQAILSDLGGILISSGTTIIGLVPLLAETSTHAASVKPLVISVVFGLLSATVLVVLVIPALYVLLDDWGWARVPEAPGSEGPQGEAGA
jgi:Cu/Ag efflux pump CusA